MSNIFIKFDGITGSVTAQNYKGWSSIHFLDIAISRNVSSQPGKVNNREGQCPIFSGISVTKDTDDATNALLKATCTGSIIPKVEIHICATGESLEPYEKYVLHNVLIAKIHKTAVQASAPTELLDLDFTKVEHTFLGKQPDSSRRAPLTTGYNLQTAQSI